MGGLARRATLIEQTRDSVEGALLVVDSGNTLMGDPLSLRSDGRVIVEAMNAMGYDALGVGTGELMKGPEVLRQRVSEATFPVLSANMVDSASGEPVLEPYAIIERGGVRFGVIGITDNAALQGLESSWPDVTILDAKETLSGYIAEIDPQVDVVVVLARMGSPDAASLAYGVPGIEVIVGGNERYVLTEAQTTGDTVFVQAGYDGEWLGRLDLARDGEAYSLSQYQILYMRPDVPNNAEMADLVQRYYRQYPE